MKIYDWFLILNLADFVASGLPSKNLTLELEGLGEKQILITHGNMIGILYDGVFLMANFNSKNPFEFDGHAVFVDPLTQNLYLGIENEG